MNRKRSNFKNQLISSSANLLIITLANLLISSSILAQPPQKMSYQSILRDKDGTLLTSRIVGMRTTILQGSDIQRVVYQETYNYTATNANGLLAVEIGSGKPTIVSGPFTSIPWSSGPFFLKTEIDPTGSTNYTISGYSQLLSVPYALYADKTGSFDETDPVWTDVSTDYYTKTNLRTQGGAEVLFGNLTGRPTTLAGYGITNAMSTSHPANVITAGDITNWNTPLSGDVSGSTVLTVTGLRGRSLAETVPVTGQVLTWNGSSWSPGNDGFVLPFSGQTTTGTSGIDIRHNATSGITIGGAFWNASTSGTAVRGNATAISGDTHGGSFQNASTSGKAVSGFASATSGTTFGGRFENWSSSGTGVYGTVTATAGTTYGGHFIASSTGGTGVYGNATAETGSTCGGHFISSSTLGKGVYGQATASGGSGHGVYGETSSISGAGVMGIALHETGENPGVYGVSNSTHGRGVSGYASATEGFGTGILGITESTSGTAVYAKAKSLTGNNCGVYAITPSTDGTAVTAMATAETGQNFAIYARSYSEEGFAAYFIGDVVVNGTLAKSAGSFKIDHPLDPENKWLSHSFVESPDMMNIYNGIVILNSQGEATVQMPEWFEALNKEFRYQLTAIGGPGPDLYISEEVKNNEFSIAGGKPGLKVSWQVTGIRKDAYAEKNRIKVEEDKNSAESGKYMNPGLFGQPDEKGVFFKNKEVNDIKE